MQFSFGLNPLSHLDAFKMGHSIFVIVAFTLLSPAARYTVTELSACQNRCNLTVSLARLTGISCLISGAFVTMSLRRLSDVDRGLAMAWLNGGAAVLV